MRHLAMAWESWIRRLGARCACCFEAACAGRAPQPLPPGLSPWVAARLCRACQAAWPPPLHQPIAHGAEGGSVCALWPYQGTLRRLIVQAKEEADGAPAVLLRHAVGHALRHGSGFLSPPPPGMAWMVVPPSRRRRWQGWYLPAYLGPPWARASAGAWRPWLRRQGHRPAQGGLNGAARRRNLRHHFRLRRPWWWTRRTLPAAVGLLDDVSTTGASLQEARRCLLAAGVGEVHAWAVAAVP